MTTLLAAPLSPLPAMGVVLAALGLQFALIRLGDRLFKPHPEVPRKLAHVLTGLTILTFPWLFDRVWPVVLLSTVAAVGIAVMKLLPELRDGIGSILTRVQRPSLGEICFPISVAMLFFLSGGDALLFCVPLLILTLADAIAALIGIGYGRVRFLTSDGLKSAEGSIAFFAIAFLSVHVPLLLFTDVGRAETLLIAVIIGLLSMLIEAISARGLDNLLIPLGAFAFLSIYQHAPAHELQLRLGATAILVIFALSWRRRSTLDDSALIGAALFGYGAWMIGGVVWLIAPALLFAIHVIAWPRSGLQRRGHTIYAVTSITSAGLIWLGVHAAYDDPLNPFLLPYAVSFAAHLAIICAARHCSEPRVGVRIAHAIAGAIFSVPILLAQMLPQWASSDTPPFHAIAQTGVSLVAILIGAIAFALLIPRLYGDRGSNLHIHGTGALLGLASSVIGFALAQLI